MRNHAAGPLGRVTTYTLLLVIVLAGLTLRTWNVNFDQGVGSHPDERSTACFYAPSIHLPASWDEFLDPQASPMNPLWDVQSQQRRSFTYGHFPLYLGIATGEVLHKLAPAAEKLPDAILPVKNVALMRRANTACAGVAVAGRLMIALLDTLTILLLFFLGRRIYAKEAGLMAAALYAFTAQAIQLSHFFAMDPASTTFTVLAVLGGVIWLQDRSWRGVWITGLGMGLAISSKFSAAPLAAVPVVAAALLLWSSRLGDLDRSQRGKAQSVALLGAPVALLLGGIVFALTSPYAILDWKNFVQATLVEQGQMVRGLADFPFTRQYRNTIPYVYFIEQQVRWGMGWPLGVVALAGTLWAALKVFIVRAKAEELIVWAWVVPYFGLTGAFLAKFNRYMSPVLPFVVLFAAGMIWAIFKAKGKRQSAKGKRGEDSPIPNPESPIPNPQSPIPNPYSRLLASALLLAIALIGGLFWSAAYVNGVYGREHTWVSASKWMYENIPAGSTIMWEQWDDALPKDLAGDLFGPSMNRGSAGLRNTDWGPYEEDTAQKYEILKAVLRESDYVAYSSKRIYGSVDELPERYPMTTRYYDLMWSGDLGFELALDQTSPPSLFGFEFQDRTADESWSLYDHPQVTLFRKVRDLSDAEFDALLGGAWETAVPYFRGKDSPLSPFLNLLGLGNGPDSQGGGLLGGIIALLTGQENNAGRDQKQIPDLMLDTRLAELPVVDDYRWNSLASDSPWLAVAWWWLVTALLGWLAWPLSFVLFARLRDRGYLLSRAVSWLLAAWMLWILVNLGVAENTVVNSWLAVALLAILGGLAATWQWPKMWAFVKQNWGLILAGEGLYAAAFVGFVLIRMANPDIWQPWFGGEKFMEFAFLNGILRSPTFPPLDPHFAGGVINYYYFGIYLVAYLVKLTGIYAEVAFNLAIPTLFALTVANSFAVAYSAMGGGEVKAKGKRQSAKGKRGVGVDSPATDRPLPQSGGGWEGVEEVGDQGLGIGDWVGVDDEDDLLDIDLAAPIVAPIIAPDPIPLTPSPCHPVTPSPRPWRDGFAAALLAPLFVAVIGNLDGLGQILRRLAERGTTDFQSAIPLVQTAVRAASGFWRVLTTPETLGGYNFWDPSRVIPASINEFPYWSFLFADLHPHLIGIPFTVLFLALALTLIRSYDVDWTQNWPRGLGLLAAFSLVLGTLASVNLWELPTYFGLGVLAFLVSQYRGRGRINLPVTLGVVIAYIAGAVLLFLPFFTTYENVGASGVGLVREPDDLGQWLLIWGFFGAVFLVWLGHALTRPARTGDAQSTGVERWLALAFGRYDRLPRFLSLARRLTQPELGLVLGGFVVAATVLAGLAAFVLGWTVLGLCLLPLGLAFLLLWRRGRAGDPGELFVATVMVTGLALLAGTQIIFLKDFLQGGDWYRMNTLFKFFIQVWVLWGVGGAIAVGRAFTAKGKSGLVPSEVADTPMGPPTRPLKLFNFQFSIITLLFLATLAYPLIGTPARLDQRMVGWRPDFGTLDGMDYMRAGSYTWPDGSHTIQLHDDWEAIRWLLATVRGNGVLVESAEIDYYRAGGTRAATFTGLSTPVGMHKNEQRDGDQVGRRQGLLNEFWSTPDLARTQALLSELDVALIYVGQLEQYKHPQGAAKLAEMAESDALVAVYRNDRVIIYAVPGKVVQGADGLYYFR